MAILAKITVGGKLILEINTDPISSNLVAPIGSKAFFNDAGVGKEYLKTGAADSAWTLVQVGAVDLTPYFKKDGSVPMEGNIVPKAATSVFVGLANNKVTSVNTRFLNIGSTQTGPAPVSFNEAGISSNAAGGFAITKFGAGALILGHSDSGDVLLNGNKLAPNSNAFPMTLGADRKPFHRVYSNTYRAAGSAFEVPECTFTLDSDQMECMDALADQISIGMKIVSDKLPDGYSYISAISSPFFTLEDQAIAGGPPVTVTMMSELSMRTEDETLFDSAEVSLRTGHSDLKTGAMTIRTGNSLTESGELVIRTGNAADPESRGIITLNGKHVSLTSKQIKDLAAGVDPEDAVNKQQLDDAIASIPSVDLAPYFKKDGSVDMAGTIRPSADATYNLGSAPRRFGLLYIAQIMAGSDGSAISITDRALLNNAGSNMLLWGGTHLSVQNHKIQDLLAPTLSGDATNKNYVDAADALLIPLAQKGAVNGVVPLNALQKIDNEYLPALAITDTFVVASEVAMLALGGSGAEKGDVAVRTDLNKSFILAGESAAILADWQELLTPTDTVLSVNGKIGAVVLTTSDIAEGTNLYFTDVRAVNAAVASEKMWLVGNATSELVTASQIKMFGTKSGDFNVELYRNSVKMIDLQSDKIVFGKDLQLGGAGAEYLRSSSSLYMTAQQTVAITAVGGTLRTESETFMERLAGVSNKLTSYKTGFVKEPASATLSDTFNVQTIQTNVNYHFELECFMHALNGAVKCDMFKKMNIHIDTNGAIVVAQDTFSSKNAGAVNFEMSFDIVGGILVATCNFGADSGTFTAKEMKMKAIRLSAE